MSDQVSVIIPCYNQGEFLAEAIDSAFAQKYDSKEIIVVNDGSSDNTSQVAGSYAGRIIYIEQGNKGFSGARNAGLRVAEGNYIAFLDSDDICLGDRLQRQAEYLDEHTNVGMVSSDALLIGSHGNIIGRKSALSGKPKSARNFRWETVEYCATTSTVMIRKSCLQRAGLFNEEMRESAEDWSMWVRLSLWCDLAYIDEPLAGYRIHGANTTQNVDRINSGNRYAVDRLVRSPEFLRYPAHFRAKLLFYRFATAWRVEPKAEAMRYLLRAIAMDPLQLPYGMRVVRQGIANSLQRRGQ